MGKMTCLRGFVCWILTMVIATMFLLGFERAGIV